MVKPRSGVDPDTAAYISRSRLAKESDPLVPHPFDPHPASGSEVEDPFEDAASDPPTAVTVLHPRIAAGKKPNQASDPPPPLLRRLFGTFNPDRVWVAVWWVVVLAVIAAFVYIFV